MKPTLLVGDHFLADKQSKSMEHVKRGDIIIFAYPKDPRKDFVKRVVGLPGDLIEVKAKALYVNGALQEETYVIHKDDTIFPADISPRDNLGPIRIPDTALFVMGDNRDASNDSRFFGPVELSEVKGRATAIYWSWDRDASKLRWDRIGKTVH